MRIPFVAPAPVPKKTPSKMDVHFSSKEETWGTPQALFDYLDVLFDLNLDPCCSETSKKCKYYYTKEDNGLRQLWSLKRSKKYRGQDVPLKTRVFMNPPYGRGNLPKWIQRMHLSVMQRHASVGLSLIPARTSTEAVVFAMENSVATLFFRRRLKFDLPGEDSTGAPFDSMLNVWAEPDVEVLRGLVEPILALGGLGTLYFSNSNKIKKEWIPEDRSYQHYVPEQYKGVELTTLLGYDKPRKSSMHKRG